MSTIVFRNANLFDSTNATIQPHASVTVEGDRIAAVSLDAKSPRGDTEIDLTGRTLLPGLIDAHVHVAATIANLFDLSLMPPSLITAQSKDVLLGMIDRGFTSVRDMAGADSGLVQAVELGHFLGPRLFIAGRAISQTGGHGDARPKFFQGQTCVTCGALGWLGSIADGVGGVRKAVREEIRNGAKFIKVMAGGGVASPNDPLEGSQYSLEEMTAIVEEATNALTYVAAHAYSPTAISRAVRCGVRTIEHGNLIDAPTARMMAERGAYLVPTLATYDALARSGKRLGWSDEMLAKLAIVRDRGVEAIKIARAAGVKIGLGTDLLGEMHVDQGIEFRLRAPAMTIAESLRSATHVNAEILNQSGQIGVIAPRALADLIVVDGDPLADPTLLESQGRHLSVIMQGGRFHKRALR